MTPAWGIVIYTVLGIMGGWGGSKLKLPAGALIGAMLAIILFKIITRFHWEIPRSFTFSLQVFLGIMVGATFQLEMMPFMRRIALPVVISCVVLVGAGVLMSLIFTRFGLMDIGTAYLGTSPGAMSALVTMAFDSKVEPMLVVCFHFFRVVFVIFTAPLIFKYFSG